MRVYDFESLEDVNKENFIVMDLKSSSLAQYKKQLGKNFTDLVAIHILLQIVDAIQGVHNAGLIHRDIKPSNFVMGLRSDEKDKVYLVDFGLAKEHLDPMTGRAMDPRRNTDFRGTIPYASLNAHNKEELSRRDDIWSFYIMLLEFLDEQIPWRTNQNKD